MIAAVKFTCRNSTKLERAGAGKKAERQNCYALRISQGIAALMAWGPLGNGEAYSNDTGVTLLVMLPVVQAKRKASASEKRV